MLNTVLLFDRDAELLGELQTENGSFVCVYLSSAGEERIGEDVARWQTEGIPYHSQERNLTIERPLPLRHPRCVDAVSQRLVCDGGACVELQPALLAFWTLISRAPFEPAERLSLIRAAHVVRPAKQQEWHAAIEAAERHSKKQPKTKAKTPRRPSSK